MPDHKITAEKREKVYISLYHGHVPKLVDERIIRFNAEQETITAGEHAEQVLLALQGMGATLDANQETHARSAMDEGK